MPLAAPVAISLALSVIMIGPAATPAAAADECTTRQVQYSPETPYALGRLNARYAWTVATGRGVVVAVVDSGVTAGNAHLRSALVPGRSLVPKLIPTEDDSGHGTAIAGQIAARKVTGSGVVGLAPEAKIMPVRVFYDSDDESRAAGVGPR
ncbi:MAG: S8 family serine peptidase, partial [Dermatophilaceae bacterium]